MAGKSRTLVLNTKVNVTGADKLVGLGKTFQNALNPKNIAGGLLAGFATSQVVSFLSDATNAAAEFTDAVAASGVIFSEEAIPELERWAETAASSFGASKALAIEGANTMATLGKAAGLAGDDLVDFATEMTELGGDLASFRGGTTEEAITAIGAALRGEMEPIRRYGVVLDDARLRQEAFELGIIKTTSQALTPQNKVLAAQRAILEDTGDAQGDFVRTSDGMANTQRELAAQFENINIEIGEKLLPYMLTLATVVKDDVLPALRDLIGLIEPSATLLGEIFDQVVPGGWARDWGEELKTAAEAGDNLEADFKGWGERWPTYVTTAADGMVTEMGLGVDGMAAELGTMPEKAADALLAAQFHLTDAIAELLEFMNTALTPAQEVFNAAMFLASQAAADGLASGNPLVVQKTQEMVNAANAVLAQHGKSAFNYGYNFGAAYARGIVNSLGLIKDAGRQMGGALKNIVAIESEPKDHSSPLYGITRWGENFVKTYAGGIAGSLGIAASTARALGSALVPSLGGSIASVSSGAGGGDIHIHLTVEGDLTSDRERGVVDLIGRALGVLGYSDRALTR